MKILLSILCLGFTSWALATATPRQVTRTIYYAVYGTPVALVEEVRAKFKAKVGQHECVTAEDLGSSWPEPLCVRFVPHSPAVKLKWDKVWQKKDLLLKVSVNGKNHPLSYRKRFYCSDGKHEMSCFNPGKFEIKKVAGDQAQAVIDHLFRTAIILGVK